MIIQFLIMNLMVSLNFLAAETLREKDVQTCHFELRKMAVTPALASRTCIQKRPLRVLENARKLNAKGLSPDDAVEEASRQLNQSVFE